MNKKLNKLGAMNSLQMTDVLNAERAGTGKPVIRHDAVLTKIRLKMPEVRCEQQQVVGNVYRPVYFFTEDQATRFMMTYNFMQDRINSLLTKPLVQDEAAPVATAHNPTKAATMAPSAVTVIPVDAPVVETVQEIGVTSGAVVGGEVVQTVNARSLHGFLQSGTKFSDWIKDRIATYGFVDGKDFTTVEAPKLDIGKPGNQVWGGDRRSIDYHVSLDMAKELAMVERTDKGKEARQYFIQCEKKLLQVAPQEAPALPSYAEALRQLASTIETNERQRAMIDVQQAALIEQAPAVEFVDKYVDTKDNINFRAVAKLLQSADPTVTELDFRAFLESNRIMYKLAGAWTAYAPHIKDGYFVLKTTVVNGYERSRALFTPAGVKWVTEKWNKRIPKLRK